MITAGGVGEELHDHRGVVNSREARGAREV